MKLHIEIQEYTDSKSGKAKPYIDSRVEPLENKGIDTYDEAGQTAKFARLIQLSKAVEMAVLAFYMNDTGDSPKSDSQSK